MTQFPHDEFAKQYLPHLVENYGIPTESKKIRSQLKEIDVYFEPTKPVPTSEKTLGLLGKLAQTISLFEVYRNPVTADEINECLSKLIEVKTEIKRTKRKNKSNLKPQQQEVKLWIFTPTLSQPILNSFSAQTDQEYQGIYLLPTALDTGIVVIHQLAKTRDTLWLRILGKGKVQENAIDEVKSLSRDDPYRENVLELVSNLYAMLEAKRLEKQQLSVEDQELIMKLSSVYTTKLEEVRQEGVKQGIQQNIIRLLKRKVGDLSPSLQAQVIALPIDILEDLGEALLDFNSIEDLTNWFNNHQ